MATANKKQEYIKLEKYLSSRFHFRLNEITGSIEFRKHSDNQWEELNEFNIYRQLKLEGFKSNLNELIYLLKSDYVERYNPFISYFESLPEWAFDSKDYIQQLCSYVKLRNPARFEKHFKKWMVSLSNVLLKINTVIKTPLYWFMNCKIQARQLSLDFYARLL